MAFIITPPGHADAPVLTISVVGGASGDLVVAGLTDLTTSNANDIYTFSTLDSSGKHSVTTTATNSVSGTFAMEVVGYEGDSGATADSAAHQGIFKLSKDKVRVGIELNIGSMTKTAEGYIAGLGPNISADNGVWMSTITFAVDGDFTLA